jgi:hypothetical protein
MMVKVNQEALKERARNLQDRGLNGFKLVLVTLQPEKNPVEAHIEARFHNGHELANIAADTASPHEVFPLSGGQRILAGSANGQVKVVSISENPKNDQVLHMTVAPIGDYSTYTLGINYQNIDPVFSEIDFKFRPACFSIECDPDWESAPAPRDNPVIDYLAKDYDSFKHTMIAAMMQRVPGWQPSSEADLDMVLIELFSAAADELSDYQDRVMNEAYLSTARKRVSVARHARLMDYHIHQGNQASTWLALRVNSEQEIDRDLVVGTGNDINDAGSVIFKSRRRKNEPPDEIDPLSVHPLMNNLGLYTWSGSAPALAAGSTSADLQLLSNEPDTAGNLKRITDRDSADTVRGLIADGKIQYLLIQEWLNPATGRVAGRNPQKRQLLKLLPGEEGAEILHDPVPEEEVHFVRVHWEKQDALKADYCFHVDCKDGDKENISLFHGNLIEVFHGRPVESVFKEMGVDKLFLLDMSRTPDPDSDAFLDALRDKLEEANIRLSTDVSVFDSDTANQWLIMDEAGNSAYRVEAGREQLKVYVWYPDDYIDYTRTAKWGAVCKLPAGPLGYKKTPLGGEIAPKSTLEVSVVSRCGTDPWDEVISLVHSDNSTESGDHFVVETDEYGQSLLRFGNDTNGMELPENAVVRCAYQVDLGLDGNIGADTLTAFDASVFDVINECWNPFDVTNGRAPEPVEEIIRNAPEAYRSRQLRAVALNDYVKRAEELDEVSKAAARYAWTGSWRTVQVTIDPVGATELSPEQRHRINRHLEAVRLIGEDLEIRGPKFVPLDIMVSLCIHPDYWVEDIRSCLKEELSEGYTPDGRRGFFHPDRWTFGQKLRASEIIGRVQGVKGVDHVKWVLMKRWNDAAPATNEITDVDFNEIIRVRNNPDFSEEGYIEFDIQGGRQ